MNKFTQLYNVYMKQIGDSYLETFHVYPSKKEQSMLFVKFVYN